MSDRTPHHSEPAREAVARAIYEALGFAYDGRTVGPNGPYGEWATAYRAADSVLALSTSPAPAASGGLEAANKAEAILRQVRKFIAAENKHARLSEQGKNSTRDDADFEHAQLVGDFSERDCDEALRIVKRRAAALSAPPATGEPVAWCKTLIDRLQRCADDPMWSDHAEVSKSLLLMAISALQEKQGAPLWGIRWQGPLNKWWGTDGWSDDTRLAHRFASKEHAETNIRLAGLPTDVSGAHLLYTHPSAETGAGVGVKEQGFADGYNAALRDVEVFRIKIAEPFDSSFERIKGFVVDMLKHNADRILSALASEGR